jgi:protein-S-isoprenylcysteine O-methyltransferase Ste14
VTDLLALATIMIWPVIPLFWIPVHFRTSFFRRLGLLTYIMPTVTWIPLAYAIYSHQAVLVQTKVELPSMLNIIGTLMLVCGTALHAWTARLLGFFGIIGVPEISPGVKEKLAAGGPFSVVRHPTYLAHTLMFSGVFLITGSISVGVVTLLDFVLVNTLIIPLEEKELVKRFGDGYTAYKKKVPARFFPGIHR